MSLIIDAHTHVKHGDRDHTEVPAEGIIAQMDEGGVDWSVIFSICEPSAASHERVLREWRKFSGRLIPFARGLPSEEDMRLYTRHALEGKARAIFYYSHGGGRRRWDSVRQTPSHWRSVKRVVSEFARKVDTQ